MYLFIVGRSLRSVLLAAKRNVHVHIVQLPLGGCFLANSRRNITADSFNLDSLRSQFPVASTTVLFRPLCCGKKSYDI